MRRKIKEEFETIYNLGRKSDGLQQAVEIKKFLLELALSENNIKSILDLGCGRLDWIYKYIKDKDYLGIDYSENACKVNNKLYPNIKVLNEELINYKQTNMSDLVICYSTLIHARTEKEFKHILNLCINKSNKAVLLSGYPYRTPIRTEDSNLTFFYGDGILETIDKLDTYNKIYVKYYDGQYYIYIRKLEEI
jgi:SAM-dependent methyltransferase